MMPSTGAGPQRATDAAAFTAQQRMTIPAPPPLTIWKFLSIGASQTRVVVVVGRTPDQVSAALDDFAAMFGLDPRWLAGVEPVKLDPTVAGPVVYVESPGILHRAGRVRGAGPLWRFTLNGWTAHPTIGGLSASGLTSIVRAATAGEAVRQLMLQAAAIGDAALRTAECAPAPAPIALEPGVLLWAEN